MYLSIEGRSIEIDKKIDIFDITSKIAAVSAAAIEFNAGSRHHAKEKAAFVLLKKVGIRCRALPGLSRPFFRASATVIFPRRF